MKLKPITWRRKWLSDRSGSWEEASLGIFTLTAQKAVWGVGIVSTWADVAHGSCRSVDDGKRKAEKWLTKKLKEVAECGQDPPITLTLRDDGLFGFWIKNLSFELDGTLPRLLKTLGETVTMLVREYALEDDGKLTLDGLELKRKVLEFVEVKDERRKKEVAE